MKIKAGVDILGMKPELLLGIMIVNEVFSESGYDLVLTSGVEGKHKNKSRHYSGFGVDFRNRHIPMEFRQVLTQMVKNALGTDFDFVAEHNHWHLEYDPIGDWE